MERPAGAPPPASNSNSAQHSNELGPAPLSAARPRCPLCCACRLRAYYEAPIKRLSTKSKSATRLKSKSESSKSKSVDAVTIPVADVTSI